MPVVSDGIPSQINYTGGHPVSRQGIVCSSSVHRDPTSNIPNKVTQSGPISTNKFYANLFLGNQNQGVWTHPYSVTWSRGGGALNSWGMAISHIDAKQRAFGPPSNSIPSSPVGYFINPIQIQSIILSAIELGASTVLTTGTMDAMAAEARLSPRAVSSASINFPLVQGMGLVTAEYTDLMPTIQSAVSFQNMVSAGQPRPGIFKYRIQLADGNNWLIYVVPTNSNDPNLKLVSSTQIQGQRSFRGIIQTCKNPSGTPGETIFDRAAGVFATDVSVQGSVTGTSGSYQIKWTSAVTRFGQTLLMFALPHHVKSFDQSTTAKVVDLHLQTTTKGLATAVLADGWTLNESKLPIAVGFAPWSPSTGTASKISDTVVNLINQVAQSELSQDYDAQTNLDSMYFSGKAFSKFAVLIYVVHDILHQQNLALQYLQRLKQAFSRFVNNQQKLPLVYDTVWNGIVSSGGYRNGGDPGQDFGNTYYNDHHFHYGTCTSIIAMSLKSRIEMYDVFAPCPEANFEPFFLRLGYFIHTAAIIGYLDPSWLPANAPWVNMLVRDASNPVKDDEFPFSRNFDWYHGHSFAKGLFESVDSKDEESSSEDTMFAYAIKMWGKITGDSSMEARGNLMLAILARTLDNYFLMTSANQNQPGNFIGNKATGIVGLLRTRLIHAAPNLVSFPRIKTS